MMLLSGVLNIKSLIIPKRNNASKPQNSEQDLGKIISWW